MPNDDVKNTPAVNKGVWVPSNVLTPMAIEIAYYRTMGIEPPYKVHYYVQEEPKNVTPKKDV